MFIKVTKSWAEETLFTRIPASRWRGKRRPVALIGRAPDSNLVTGGSNPSWPATSSF